MTLLLYMNIEKQRKQQTQTTKTAQPLQNSVQTVQLQTHFLQFFPFRITLPFHLSPLWEHVYECVCECLCVFGCSDEKWKSVPIVNGIHISPTLWHLEQCVVNLVPQSCVGAVPRFVLRTEKRAHPCWDTQDHCHGIILPCLCVNLAGIIVA